MRPVLPCIMALCAAAGCGPNLTHVPESGPAAVPGCVPDLDGRIDAAELRPVTGLAAVWSIGGERAVDVAGTVDAAGRRIWDWSQPAADRAVSIAGTPVRERWFADSFPPDAFTVPFDADATLESVYRHDESALWMLGLASAHKDPAGGRTLLVYAQPVALYRFPLALGEAWESTGQVERGTLRGLPYMGRDRYAVRVESAGRLVLPDLTFTQALRVRATVTVEPAGAPPVTRRQSSYMFECFGEVARATARDGETRDDFETAAEVRRLSLDGIAAAQ